MSASCSACDLLPWDSEFFGKRIARLTPARPSSDDLDQAISWCESEQVDCLYFLCDTTEAETHSHVASKGFRSVDTRVILRANLSTSAAAGTPEWIRPCRQEDVPALTRIARHSHTHTRFYSDDHFSKEQCDELYATWIEKSCKGYADRVLVAAPGADPEGYITCHFDNSDSGHIGLTAVEPHSRGKGYATALVQAALQVFSDESICTAQVATQGGNSKALRLYENAGFVIEEEATWFHWWRDQLI